MDYYKENQYIAALDKKGNILGNIEKWEAHKKGILHKAFTVIIQYKNFYVLQHRKHPVFDGVFDLSCSSHQIYINEMLQDTTTAALIALKREWGILEKDIVGKIKIEKPIYYKAKDKNTGFFEHEVCDQVFVKVREIPAPNFTYAYGISLVTKEDLRKKEIYNLLAPWAKKTLALILLS